MDNRLKSLKNRYYRLQFAKVYRLLRRDCKDLDSLVRQDYHTMALAPGMLDRARVALLARYGAY